MDFVNFTDMKGISQDFSDCGLRHDKYTKNLFNENCVFRALCEMLENCKLPFIIRIERDISDNWPSTRHWALTTSVKPA